jgi:hypothetical protein
VKLPPAQALGGDCSCTKVTTTRVARIAYCDSCAEELLGGIRARVIGNESGSGYGRELRPRPDWGDGWADMSCSVCDAGWTGRPGSPCRWCQGRAVRRAEEQCRLLLRPELPDRGDPQRRRALEAWAERLARAVNAGVVTEAEARTAIARNR